MDFENHSVGWCRDLAALHGNKLSFTLEPTCFVMNNYWIFGKLRANLFLIPAQLIATCFSLPPHSTSNILHIYLIIPKILRWVCQTERKFQHQNNMTLRKYWFHLTNNSSGTTTTYKSRLLRNRVLHLLTAPGSRVLLGCHDVPQLVVKGGTWRTAAPTRNTRNSEGERL